LGKPFSTSTFTNELAVGAGVGLRVDVSFFIFRFDFATPLKKPWLEGNNWVIDQVDFTNTENWVLNVAIGYPF
jgi:outer membrane protein assembly factor BamA